MSLTIPEVKPFVGRNCAVIWRDRLGHERGKVLQVRDVS